MHERPDGELHLRAIAGFSIVLVLVLVGSFAGMWWLGGGFEKLARSESRPTPPPLPDLAPQTEIEGPRLQAHPEREWREMSAEESADLASYRLLDPASGRVQIPLDAAVERVLAEGLPEWPAEGN